jgi:hypothetical protein
VSAPGIAVDDTVAARSLKQSVDYFFHGIEELVAQT